MPNPEYSSPVKKKANFFDLFDANMNETNDEAVTNYLMEKDKNLSCLKRYPTIERLYRQYNTPLPSSAACERLFSKGSLVLTKKRERLSVANFEMQLILNANKDLW